MFKKRGHSDFFLIGDVQPGQNSLFSPQVGDIASIRVDENNIEIHVKLESEKNGTWKGHIVSYHTEITGITSSERHREIRRDENFVNDNNLSNGTKINLNQNTILGLYR